MRLRHRHMDARLSPGLAGLWRLRKLHSGHAHGLLEAQPPLLVLGQVMAAAHIDLQQIIQETLDPMISHRPTRIERKHKQALEEGPDYA